MKNLLRNNKGQFVKGIRSNPKGEFKKGSVPWNTKDRVEVLCQLCGSTYKIIPFRVGRSKFCSASCRSTHNANKYRNPDSFDRRDHNAYIKLHNWVNMTLGKAMFCEKCENESSVYHWANKTGKYLKNVKDWISLCPRCHYKYDIERGIRKFVH